jgi:thiamine biosynthesis protein ThiC
MAQARIKNGCKGTIDASICPELTKEALRETRWGEKKCTMCGKYCALTSADEIFYD